MKARITGFLEVEDKIREVVSELDRRPMNRADGAWKKRDE
jgi:hypothetical protein